MVYSLLDIFTELVCTGPVILDVKLALATKKKGLNYFGNFNKKILNYSIVTRLILTSIHQLPKTVHF